MPRRKDKYEPKNPEKIQYAYEEEVIASKENAEEEKYIEDTELADGEVSNLPMGLEDFVEGTGDDSIDSDEDEQSEGDSPKEKTRKSKAKKAGKNKDYAEEVPIEDAIYIPTHVHTHMHAHPPCM